jgi:uncharacterized protein (TIGR03503 family)
MKEQYIIRNDTSKRSTRKALSGYCMFLIAFSGIVLNSTFSSAESKKESAKPERVIKRKPAEEKKAKHSDAGTVHAPDAIESKHDFQDKEEVGIGGLEAVLLLDSSRSMQKTDPKRIRDQGAKLFLQFLEPEDKVSIIEFSDVANVLMDLKSMKSVTSQEIVGLLENIKNEGNFTNFLAPLESALDILLSSETKNASKVVILLTDGQMDPSSIPEQKEEFVNKLLKDKLPEYAKRNIKVFTLGLSDLADKELLSEIAKKTDAHAEYAQDVNTIHTVFSNIFLSIKKPQVLELESGGFSIDGNTSEATFFINRQTQSDSIIVIDPTGKEYVNKDFPSSWKWFRGDLFDVITIPSPLPGRWGIKGGVGDLTGFAKLLSDLKLEYSFPSQSFSVGDSAVVKVRLTESGKILDDKDLASLIFYSYRIVNVKTGQVYLQGQFADKGDRGDEKAGDGVFSDILTLNEEGEYKLFLVATAPTFTRQAHIPFNVSAGLISLNHIPRNEFTGAKDSYVVSLLGSSKELEKRIVAIDAVNNGEKYQVNLEKYKISEDSYQVPLDRLKSGENLVVALLQGLDKSKHEVRAKSEQVKIKVDAHVVAGHEEAAENKIAEEVVLVEGEHAEEIKVDGEHVEPENESYLIWGIISLLISLICSGVIAKIFIGRSKTDGGSKIEVREEYVIPSTLNEQLEVILSKVGDDRREFFPAELAIFASIIDSDPESIKTLQKQVSKDLGAVAQPGADDADHSGEASDAEGESVTQEETAEEEGA